MRVLLVDDDCLIQESLKIILEVEEDIEVCALASNGEEAFLQCKEHDPDIVLMDIRMPILDGVLGTRKIKECFPNLPVVILTTFQDDEYIRQAVAYGAEGYILKNQSSESIINTLRAVMRGNAVYQRDVAHKLNSMLKDARKDPQSLGLTERELEVLMLIAQGKSNKEIASELFLGEGTVRNYTTALLEKLDLRDRTQLAIFYLKNVD